jgi:hypothetical protein
VNVDLKHRRIGRYPYIRRSDLDQPVDVLHRKTARDADQADFRIVRTRKAMYDAPAITFQITTLWRV